MFKNRHVGRPSNEELKIRRNKKIIMILIPVVFIVAIVLSFKSGTFKNLMGNSVIEFECENGTKPFKENGKQVCEISLDAILLGDINLDGKLDNNDIILMQQAIDGAEVDEYQFAAADINGNDNIDTLDIEILTKYLNGEEVISTYKSYNLGQLLTCAKGHKLTGDKCVITVDAKRVEKVETIYGDVNNDGKVNETDLDYLTKYLANYSEYALTEQGKINADLNADAKVDAKDRIILSRYLGKEETQIFTIKYDANGGTGNMDDQDITFGVNTKLNKNQFTNNGYDFIGWTSYNNTTGKWYCYTNSEKTMTGKVDKTICERYGYVIYKDQATVSKTGNVGEMITMYAQWSKIKTFKIKYDANGGTGNMSAQNITYGVDTKLNNNKFTKKGYVFDGWISYNNTTGKWYCYTNSEKTTTGKVDKATCEKYGYVKYRNQATVSKSANVGETVTFMATWLDPTKAVTVTFTPETSSTTVYSRYKYKIDVSLTLNSSINDYYYKWITYKDDKVNYNGTCSKVSTKTVTYTLDMMAKRYGQIAIYSDKSCSKKITSYNTKTYNLSSVIWPVTPQFQLLEHDKMVTRYKHYVYGTNSEGHEGLDITIPIGTPVYAIADGTVRGTNTYSGANKDEDYGNVIFITTKINGKNYSVAYAHLKDNPTKYVKVGQTIKKGQLIGYSGITGGSRIPHLHIDFNLLNSNNKVTGNHLDPLNVLPSISNFKKLKATVSRMDYTVAQFPDSSIELYNNMRTAQNNNKTWNYVIYGIAKNSVNDIPKNAKVELINRSKSSGYVTVKYNGKQYSVKATNFKFNW